LHFNENAGHPQATASAGEPLSTVDLPEHQKGECTVKPVKAEATFCKFDMVLFHSQKLKCANSHDTTSENLIIKYMSFIMKRTNNENNINSKNVQQGYWAI